MDGLNLDLRTPVNTRSRRAETCLALLTHCLNTILLTALTVGAVLLLDAIGVRLPAAHDPPAASLAE